VYQRINEKISIRVTVVETRNKSHLGIIGHLIRNNKWLTTIAVRKPEGKPGRGKPRQSFVKQLILDIRKVSYIELKDIALNREKRRNILSFNQSKD
jgi:hypothetical protein